MKIIVKNIKQVPHDVEIESDAITILELKKAIEMQHNFEADNMKLLCNGVVLEDTKTVGSYSIKEGTIVIMILAKGKMVMNQPLAQLQQQQSNLVPLNPNVIPQETKISAIKLPPKPNKEVKEAVPPQKVNEYPNEIKALVEMGFSKEESGNAIQAAKGSVQIANEFLYNGLPDQEMADAYADNGNMSYEDGNDNDNDNEQQLQHDENEALSEEGEGEANDNDLNLQKMSSVIKVLYSQDPSNLEGIILNVQQHSPEILQLIQENQEEFQNMLKEPVTDEDLKNYNDFQKEGQQQPLHNDSNEEEGEEESNNPNPNTNNQINLTNEEYDAVKKIKEMGNFNEMETIQAYLACEKNVEMAANYLFENKANNHYYNQYQFSLPQPPQQLQQQQPQQKPEDKDKPK